MKLCQLELRLFSPGKKVGLAVLAGGLISCAAGVVAPGLCATAIDEAQKADQFLVVDCLLPSQVRQLGVNMTYLAPRQAIKTSASDCAIRGGEYVAYDRANYATALKVWLPRANEGDKVAQTYVGEIFEKGLGTAPDYSAAASWYQKAAAQGYSRALINLGFLYEQGLGVPKEPATALKLYRKAAGLEGSIALDAPTPSSAEEVKALRAELDRTRRELGKAKQDLDKERLKSSSEIERLTQQKLNAAASGNSEETRRLEALLKQRESELEQRRQQVARLEQTTEDFRARLTRMEGETATLRQDLDQARRQVAQSQKEVDQRRSAAAELGRKLEAMQQEIAKQKQAGSAADQAKIKALETELANRRDEFQRQHQELVRLESDVKTYKARVATLEEVREPPTQTVAYGPPTIQIIDPPVVLTRDTATVKVRKGLNARAIVGRVTAPAGLLSFTVNDVVQEVDANGLFNTRVDLGVGKTKVALLAVDRQGKRALTDFILEQELVEGKPTESARRKPIGLDLGKYHALVIGNQKYQKLPSLETPEVDAKEISDVLKDRYGFTVTTLMNATRYQILSELNKFRAKLNENDNFLIYYAGHGELDRANARGHWLPVDAEPDSDANWISSITVTDILNAMTVKHALIVADSCYSGAMTRGSIGQLESGMTDDARLNWYKSIAKARSRTALTSGGLKPVLDNGGGKHSVFAQNFINILMENQDILEGQRLYREISARVLNLALKQRFEQRPEYAPLRFAGHESGDFLFLPSN